MPQLKLAVGDSFLSDGTLVSLQSVYDTRTGNNIFGKSNLDATFQLDKGGRITMCKLELIGEETHCNVGNHVFWISDYDGKYLTVEFDGKKYSEKKSLCKTSFEVAPE